MVRTLENLEHNRKYLLATTLSCARAWHSAAVTRRRKPGPKIVSLFIGKNNTMVHDFAADIFLSGCCRPFYSSVPCSFRLFEFRNHAYHSITPSYEIIPSSILTGIHCLCMNVYHTIIEYCYHTYMERKTQMRTENSDKNNPFEFSHPAGELHPALLLSIGWPKAEEAGCFVSTLLVKNWTKKKRKKKKREKDHLATESSSLSPFHEQKNVDILFVCFFLIVYMWACKTVVPGTIHTTINSIPGTVAERYQ